MTSFGNEPLFLGIDGGGSKCRAVLYRKDSGIIGEGLAGPANPVQGLERAQDAVLACASAALSDAGLSQSQLGHLIVGAGLAGVNAPRTRAAMLSWQHPFAQFYLTTDLHIASLGAHDGTDGAVIITGTGSSGFAQCAGQQRFLGGHGFPLGDKAGGAWLGLAAVQAALLALDNLGPATSLSQAVLAKTHSQDSTALMDQFCGQPSAPYGQLAALVFDEAAKGDAVAKAIVADGAGYLSNMVLQLTELGPIKVAFIGGLGGIWQPWLSGAAKARITPALQGPEVGAVIYAQQRYTGEHAA